MSVPSARFDVVDGQQVVTIRPARDDDADTIARIWHEAWGDGHRGNVPDALVRHRGREQFLRGLRSESPTAGSVSSTARRTAS